MIEVAIDRVLKATHGRTEHMKVLCDRGREGGRGGRKRREGGRGGREEEEGGRVGGRGSCDRSRHRPSTESNTRQN